MKGSIVKRGESYSIVLDLYEPHPETGRMVRKQKWIAAGPRRKAAEQKLAALVNDAHNGQLIEPSKVTFSQWLGTWIDNLATAGKVRPASIARYRGIVARAQQAPEAAIPLQLLRPSHLEAYYARLLKDLSPATVRLHHGTLHTALEKARRDRRVPVNVAADADRPKADRDKGKHARAECWRAEEARRFLDAADAASPQASAFYSLALDTGARLRELAGLKWEDVDFDRGQIQITRQLAGTWARYANVTDPPMFGPTKSGKTRQIRIAAETVQRLRAHKRTQAETRMASRTKYQDHGLVFATALGQPLAVHNLGIREYAALIRASGVRRIKFHGLRHTTATLLLQAGEPVANVAARLGHAKASMTLDVYAHALEQTDTAPRTSRVLYGA